MGEERRKLQKLVSNGPWRVTATLNLLTASRHSQRLATHNQIIHWLPLSLCSLKLRLATATITSFYLTITTFYFVLFFVLSFWSLVFIFVPIYYSGLLHIKLLVTPTTFITFCRACVSNKSGKWECFLLFF
jgi:hypothetical protein